MKQHGGESVKLTAREGRMRMNQEDRTLVLQVTDSQIQRGDEFGGAVPGETEIPYRLAMR